MGEVIVVASGKDGVGKTVITSNLGAVLAKEGHSVLLLDLNIGYRNLDISLGVENRVVYDLADVVMGVCRIKQAMIKITGVHNFFLISAPQNKGKTSISNVELSALCSELKKIFDFVIIDAPAVTENGLALAISSADKAVVVIVPEYAAIRDAEPLNAMLADKGIIKKCVIINKIMPGLYRTGLVPDPEEISEMLRLPIVGMVAFDQNIHISSNIGMPIAAVEDRYAETFKKIVDRITSRS